MNSLPSSTKGFWKGSHYVSQGATGHWSKWGGGKKSAKQERPQEFWYCSSCAEQQHESMPRYDYKIGENEYVKVCSKCANDGCLIIEHRIRELTIEFK